MKLILQIVFIFFTWFTNQVYSNEPFFKFTQSIHGVNKGYSIRVAKIWDDFDNGLYLSDLNIYNAANDGTVLLDDIIELSSIKLRRPNGTFADVEYRVVITSQGKVRMISKFNLDKIVNSAGSSMKKVVLGSEDLSQFAVNYRKTLTIPNHKGNVAVFEYLDNSGNLIKKAFTTEVGVASHSEELAIDFFTNQNIPKSSIKRIYSELEPCELAGHTCKAKLTENFPTAQKVFSYDYPGGVDNTIRAASVNQRYIDLEQLLK